MPDWNHFVKERLGRLHVATHREQEIQSELAEHLEDAYQEALQRGLTHEAAAEFAHKQVTDWRRLSRKIRRAEREEHNMSHTTKTLWLPGVSGLFLSTFVLLIMTRIMPPRLWLDSQGILLIGISWIVAYVAFGALGAYWSRRAAGNRTNRVLAGTFPLALHLAVFILPIIVALISPVPTFPEHLMPGFLLRAGILWLVVPGTALAAGTLPFLRRES